MSDITKCTNKECGISNTCYRFTSKPSEYNQYYSKFEPKIDSILDEIECDMYIEDKKRR